MDLLKTLLVYMMVVLSSATESNPSVTPVPPSVTPAPTAYVSMAPTATSAPTATLAPTATPTTAPAQYATLSKGSKGDDVRKLQRRLQELGYYTGAIDGDFGNQTKKAVERFQNYNDLKVDGIAGRDTQTMLYESTAVVTAPPEITQGPTTAPTVTAEPVTVSVPVYYVDQDGKILEETVMTIYSTATIYAQSNLVPEGYAAISPSSVKVTVENGIATPVSVAFRYQAPAATEAPTEEPTTEPTEQPTEEPTAEPTQQPTEEPTAEPTQQPTEEPTAEPTQQPTEEPTAEPTQQPTEEPTAEPTQQPTEEPTAEPTQQPTEEPTAEPTQQPTEEPTADPTQQPTEEPAPLTQAGTVLGVNGEDQNVLWYRNAENIVYVELKALADAALLPCDAPDGMLSMTLNGNNIAAVFSGDTLTSFLVDGQELTNETLLPLIWDSKLYVSDALLTHLGVTCTDGGNILALDNVIQ